MLCVGYTIGTGAVTKLAAAGAQSGLQLLWAVLGGSLLFWVLLEAYGRYAVVAGTGALHGFRTHLPGGRWLALLVLIGIAMGQWSGLPVLVTLVSQLSYEGLALFLPLPAVRSQGVVMGLAAVMMAGVYGLIATGRYSLLEKAMLLLVTLMVGGFTGAMWLAQPECSLIVGGLAPSLPAGAGGIWPAVVVIGTTVAAPTFLLRALWLKGRGWDGKNVKDRKGDAMVAAFSILLVCATIMGCAAGALRASGVDIRDPFGAIQALASTAGRLAAGLFLVGALGAGLSSIIPMAMILPLLMADYRREEPRLHTRQFRIWAAMACAVGLTGPVSGEWLLPLHRLASQLAQVFVLPLVVAGIFVLLNRVDLMGAQRAGFWLNAGLMVALVFSLLVAGQGLAALERRFG
jgi:Mn2+/Fe2+ NRAMP family transporter